MSAMAECGIPAELPFANVMVGLKNLPRLSVARTFQPDRPIGLGPVMNYDQLKRNVGRFVKLMPPACHLNAAGEVEGCPNEDWED